MSVHTREIEDRYAEAGANARIATSTATSRLCPRFRCVSSLAEGRDVARSGYCGPSTLLCRAASEYAFVGVECADLSSRGALMERRPGKIPISDFGFHHIGTAPHTEVLPESIDDVIELVRSARKERVPLRLRAGAHTLNGVSVPRPGELLVRMDRLRAYRFERRGTLRVQAGVSMWDVRDFVASNGYRLPVFNNGSTGPTVGGFIAAGGMGEGSVSYGGMWCNVASLRVVTGEGEVMDVGPADDEFPYWFGSLGTLGIIVEAELLLLPVQEGSGPAVANEAGKVPALNRSHEVRYPGPGEELADEVAFWVTVLTRGDREVQAMTDLLSLMDRHTDHLSFLPVFRYNMAYRGLTAPLVFPEPCDFAALFLWGQTAAATAKGRAALLALEGDFHAMCMARGYRRYLQTELVGPSFDFRRYFGDDLYDTFTALKARRDPDRIINPGVLGT